MAEEREKRKIGERRPHAQRLKRVHADTTSRHFEQLTRQARALAGEDEEEEQEVSLEAIRARISGLQERHVQLRATLSKPEKAQGAKLAREFEEARANDSGTSLPDSALTDSLIESVFEQAHSDAVAENENPVSNPRLLYHIGRKSIYILSNRRIGIQFSPTLGEEAQENYYCVLSTKPPSEKIIVSKDNIPFCLPLRELEKTHLQLSATTFIDELDNHLQAFVGRRGQILWLKEHHADSIGDLYHSLPYNLIKFSLDVSNCKAEVELVFQELASEYPTDCTVLVWSLAQPARRTTARRGTRAYQVPQVASRRVTKAEEILRTRLLPEAYDDLVKEIQLASATEEA